MDPLHVVLLILTAVITASQFVATNFPGTNYAAIAHAVAGICASLMPLIGALSSQLVTKPAVPAVVVSAGTELAVKPAAPVAGPLASAVVAQDASTLAVLNQGK